MTNKVFPTRIRSVRFKNGGEIRLLPSQREEVSRQLRATLQSEADDLFERLDNAVAGFALVLWAANGDVGSYVEIEHTSPWTAPAIPHLVEEETRQALQSSQINRALGRDDDEVV